MMNVSGQVIPTGNTLLRRVGPSLSKEARRRLQWMEFYERHGRNARLTCRHFGISPDVFYRWRRRYNPRRLESLEDDRRTRRPLRVRQPQTPPEVVARIRQLRGQYPVWSKYKLAVLLNREGITVSPSTVGRWFGRLRRLGMLREPPLVVARREKRARRRQRRPYAQRKPRDYEVRMPGDLVQVDVTPIEVRPGLRRAHFTSRDVVSRKDVLAARGKTSSKTAESVLREDFQRFGFPVRAIQIDGGSEFRGEFEAACEALGIHLFLLPPRSPKLNAHVERGHRTHQEEFYDLYEMPDSLVEHNALLQQWERIYNDVRPHQALGYLTPNEYLARCQPTRLPLKGGKVYGIC
jgi:transposase InsO family protein